MVLRWISAVPAPMVDARCSKEPARPTAPFDRVRIATVEQADRTDEVDGELVELLLEQRVEQSRRRRSGSGLPLLHDGGDHARRVQRHDALRAREVGEPLPHDRVVGPAALPRQCRELAHDPLVETRLGERPGGAFVAEAGPGDVPPVVLLADAVLDGDLDTVEEDLAEPRVAGHVAQRTHGHAGCVRIDQQVGDAGAARVRTTGAHQAEEDVGDVGARAPHLLPADDVVVTVANRSRTERREVGTGVGLRVALGPDHVGPEHRTQPARLLLLSAVADDRGARDADAGPGDTGHAGARHLLRIDDLLLEREVHPAVLARPTRPGEVVVDGGRAPRALPRQSGLPTLWRRSGVVLGKARAQLDAEVVPHGRKQ